MKNLFSVVLIICILIPLNFSAQSGIQFNHAMENTEFYFPKVDYYVFKKETKLNHLTTVYNNFGLFENTNNILPENIPIMHTQENKVKAYIETEISRVGLSDYVSQVIVPTEKVVQIRNGKKVNRERVYFPGYIMVEANLSGEVPHVIKGITGVIGFLGETKGGEPVPMRKSEVNRMLGKVDELSVQDENIAIPFNIGETVKVVDGPFNGFDGTIEKVNEEKRKLEVMVKIFGRKTPLELSFMQVEKV